MTVFTWQLPHCGISVPRQPISAALVSALRASSRGTAPTLATSTARCAYSAPGCCCPACLCRGPWASLVFRSQGAISILLNEVLPELSLETVFLGQSFHEIM